jgi:hypothetical protein
MITDVDVIDALIFARQDPFEGPVIPEHGLRYPGFSPVKGGFINH